MGMFLTKYNPVSALDTLFDTFDREFFPTLSRFFETREEDFRVPMANIYERDNEYVITMEMPGVSKKNVDVSIDGDNLIITGEKVEKLDSKGLLRREIRAEKFRRSFLLDGNIDRDKIKAKMEDGILRVTLPKKAESVGRKVDIE